MEAGGGEIVMSFGWARLIGLPSYSNSRRDTSPQEIHSRAFTEHNRSIRIKSLHVDTGQIERERVCVCASESERTWGGKEGGDDQIYYFRLNDARWETRVWDRPGGATRIQRFGWGTPRVASCTSWLLSYSYFFEKGPCGNPTFPVDFPHCAELNLRGTMERWSRCSALHRQACCDNAREGSKVPRSVGDSNRPSRCMNIDGRN
ncbi:uncharacterized protein BO95DRAFT_16886 [Aspergillus brunneoviolaceus CBS 621.78]|uniref:Uncharacterized protein n=1 Tax=Aspergillus brunneoviolaceus CBS 621.78 TaxID=1450534 RepID=A0ACD1FTZ2_9EURO|nr:hypothetical protein BO95DRAFT_16886 [Aspergillus brunneoviolaceus CBS 621.78]RAH40424.1 hypothetical protein BO95DRAFT_16886 [Aspergillus brunneoviolaceus CBS 621.78]